MNEWKLSENITRLRHEKKITQEELASFAGVTKASVSACSSYRRSGCIREADHGFGHAYLCRGAFGSGSNVYKEESYLNIK